MRQILVVMCLGGAGTVRSVERKLTLRPRPMSSRGYLSFFQGHRSALTWRHTLTTLLNKEQSPQPVESDRSSFGQEFIENLWTLDFENLRDWADGLKELHAALDGSEDIAGSMIEADILAYMKFLISAVAGKVGAEAMQSALMLSECKKRPTSSPSKFPGRARGKGPSQYCLDAIGHIDKVHKFVREFNNAVFEIISRSGVEATSIGEEGFRLIEDICQLVFVRGEIMAWVSGRDEGGSELLPGALQTFTESTAKKILAAARRSGFSDMTENICREPRDRETSLKLLVEKTRPPSTWSRSDAPSSSTPPELRLRADEISSKLPQLRLRADTIKRGIQTVRDWIFSRIDDSNKSALTEAMSLLNRNVVSAEGSPLPELTDSVSRLTAIIRAGDTFDEQAARAALTTIENFLINRSFELSETLASTLEQIKV